MEGLAKFREYVEDLSDLFKVRVDLFKHLQTIDSEGMWEATCLTQFHFE